MDGPQRLTHLFDDGHYETVPVPDASVDPLKFRDARRYTDRLKEAKPTFQCSTSACPTVRRFLWSSLDQAQTLDRT